MKIEGLKCNGCVRKLKEEFELVSEVVSVETVDLQTKLAAVCTQPETPYFVLESAISNCNTKEQLRNYVDNLCIPVLKIIKEETGKQVTSVLELGLGLLGKAIELEMREDWIRNVLEEKLGMTNIHLPKEPSHLFFAESASKVVFDDMNEAMKEIDFDLDWFLCYQDLEEDFVGSSSMNVRNARIRLSPLISCSHCREKISSLLNNALQVNEVEFLDNPYDGCFRVELYSIWGFHSLEKIFHAFSRAWIPLEAISSFADFCQNLSSCNNAKELVVDCNTVEMCKRDKLVESIASSTGVFFVQKNYSEMVLLRIVYNESVVSQSEILEKIVSLGFRVDVSRDCSILSSVSNAESTNNPKVGTLNIVKRYNCGCNKPNCCCLSLPLKEMKDHSDEALSFTEIVFKDSGSPRAVDELATYLSCRSCHFNKEQKTQCEVLQKMDEEEIVVCTDSPICTLSSTDTPQSFQYQREKKTAKLATTVSGMSCASCVGAIENCLKRYDGIVNVSIGLITSMANIEFIADKISPEEIQRAIESLGYEVSTPKVIDSERDSEELVFGLQVTDGSVADSICQILKEQPEVEHFQKESMIMNDTVEHVLPTQHFPFSLLFPKSKMLTYRIIVHLDENEVMKWRLSDSKECKNGEHVNPKIRLMRLLHARNLECTVVSGNTSKEAHHSQLRKRLEMEANKLLLRCIVSAIFTIPIMIFSFGLANHVRGVNTRLGKSQITVAYLVEWILATFIQLIGGYPFYRGSYFAIFRSHRPNMDVLIALATSTIYVYSVASLIYYSIVDQPGRDIDFDSSSMLITIITFGKWLEAIAKKNAAKGFEMFDELAPKQVTVVFKDEKEDFVEAEVVNPELVMVGDIIKVLPGERFAVDGIVEAGESSVDESTITGESLPVHKKSGDSVFSGTSNGNSILYVRTTASGSQNTVSQILELVENAQNSHAPIESIADTISAYFVIWIVLIAILVYLIWVILIEKRVVPDTWYDHQSPIIFSLVFSVSVVAVACPCALGLATPSAFMTASSVAVRFGILLKESAAVQYLYNAACVVFDKTGTLTRGFPKVLQVQQLNIFAGLNQDKIVSLIAQVESHSDHPYANAIVRYAEEERGLEVSKQVQSFEEKPGCGVESVIESHEIFVGSWNWIKSKCSSSQGGKEDDLLNHQQRQLLNEWMEDGSSVVVAAIDNVPCIAFRVHDELRPEAKQVVAFFREKKKMECWLVTGDNENTAFSVAKAVGIPVEKVVSQALPGDKVKILESSIEKYRNVSGKYSFFKPRVVFVGDGVNDGPALAMADVGIAMGSKNQLAAGAARAIVMNDNLHGLVTLFDLSRVTFRRILLNYFWALVYNVVFVPGAAGAMFPLIRQQMPPWFAAILMASSSLSVSLSSLLLRFYRPLRNI
ncbi:Probable copper-transporting ATPase HMA5 [Galdieria sulphuraria]|nr:Probable copper-transporting ATPase HMA5 [Galdieria sulphuraria]